MQLTVTVEAVKYANPTSKWYLLRCMRGGDGQPETTVICKGTLGWTPNKMETLTLTGEWVVYKGERQFQFRGAKLTLPMDPRGQLHYVCLRAHGIGASIEQQIWDMMGENWRKLARGAIRKMANAVYDSFFEQI